MEKGDIVDMCAMCKENVITGYGYVPDPPGEYYAGINLQAGDKVCFFCCGEMDKLHMEKEGKISLYLVRREKAWYVINWPGSLEYRATVSVSKKGHYSPLSGYMERRDAHFRDEQGNMWWGRSIGQWTDIIHCKRLKSKRAIESAAW